MVFPGVLRGRPGPRLATILTSRPRRSLSSPRMLLCQSSPPCASRLLRARSPHPASLCDDALVDDAIARYRAASEAKDIDALIATLAPDASVASPISGHMLFRGTADLRVLLAAVYGSLSELHWHSEVGDGRERVVIGHAKLGPVGLDDAMVF